MKKITALVLVLVLTLMIALPALAWSHDSRCIRSEHWTAVSTETRLVYPVVSGETCRRRDSRTKNVETCAWVMGSKVVATWYSSWKLGPVACPT